MALKVVRNEIDGWDVVREDEDVALSNHPDRETAEQAAAQLRAEEEHIGESGGEPVVVATGEVHGIDDARAGHEAGLPVPRRAAPRDHDPGRGPRPHRVADGLRQLARPLVTLAG